MSQDKWGEKEQSFLRELSELSKKHGIVVTGCGCCGSPSLTEVDRGPRQSWPSDGHYSVNIGDGCDVQWVPADEP